MWYKCEKCGLRERIWNSRPRVTPFVIRCRECDGDMTHVDWELDKYDPNYIPEKGDRIFVDLSRETAECRYRQMIDKYWDHKDHPLSKNGRFKTKQEALDHYLSKWEFGHPALEEI
jgi:hypothetical protein